MEVSGADAKVDTRLLAFHRDDVESSHSGSERLSTTHAPKATREHPTSGGLAVEMLPGHLREGFVGALHDALGADVEPRSRGHLAIHGETHAIQLFEMLDSGPVGHQVGVGNHDPR